MGQLHPDDAIALHRVPDDLYRHLELGLDSAVAPACWSRSTSVEPLHAP